MKSKLISFLILLILLLAAVWLSRRNDSVSRPANRPYESQPPASSTGRRGLDRTISYLDYSAHARCRMKCRHITMNEVEDILQHGTINYRKSDPNDRPCPTYALEGYTLKDNQHVRIVFAQCSTKTKVVTCIDLDQDFACECK